MSVRDRVARILTCIDRYNPENADVLADYLLQTGETGTSDVEAYLALIKLFQFNPHLYDLETTCSILLKTLSTLPRSDFVLCLAMLTEEQHENAKIAKLVQLSQHLELCQFDLFWAVISSDPSILDANVRIKRDLSELSHVEVAQCLRSRQLSDDGSPDEQRVRLAEDVGRETGSDAESLEELQTWIYRPLVLNDFEDAIRKYVAHVIDRTYQVIAKADLGLMVNLKEPALSEFIKAQGWKEAIGEDGSSDVFVSSKVDSIKSKNVIDRLDFQNFTGFLSDI